MRQSCRRHPTREHEGIDIVRYHPSHLPALAERAAARVRACQELVPAVPPALCDPGAAAGAITELVEEGRVLVAEEHGEAVAHLGWLEFPVFRRVPRPTAWVPDVGVGTTEPAVWEALFITAAHEWDATARQGLFVTVPVGGEAIMHWLGMNGFGRMLHDTVQPCRPDGEAPHVQGITVRAATTDDGDALHALDVEHCAHYGRPPTFMVPGTPTSAAAWRTAVERRPGSVWVGDDGRRLVGFITVQPTEEALPFLRAPHSVTVTGIYTLPEVRGRGLAAALFHAGRTAAADRGAVQCLVDHETVNPTALHFWPTRTTLAAVSFMRVLERP